MELDSEIRFVAKNIHKIIQNFTLKELITKAAFAALTLLASVFIIKSGIHIGLIAIVACGTVGMYFCYSKMGAPKPRPLPKFIEVEGGWSLCNTSFNDQKQQIKISIINGEFCNQSKIMLEKNCLEGGFDHTPFLKFSGTGLQLKKIVESIVFKQQNLNSQMTINVEVMHSPGK